MRVAVISPHANNNGNTTLAMLIGLELANRNKLTCLTHALPSSPSFYHYLAFRGFPDKTSTPSQIVKVLKEGGLSSEEARDYCRGINDNLEAFTNETSNFSQEDMNFMYKYIAKMFPHDNVVFDIDDDNEEQCKAITKLCDVVVLNLTQSIKELNKFKENKDKYMEILKEKPLVVVVNKYNSTISNIKEVAHWMGIKKPNGWLVLHYNPWISWATSHGRLGELYRVISKKDPRVIELQADLTKICNTIEKAKSSTGKKRGS